jgi:hypothetical protein
LPVLTSDDTQEINLTEMASRTTILSGELNREALADVDISPYYQHTAQLQLNRRYAEGIANDIISAKIYSEETPSVYILVSHNKAYHRVFYNPQKLELREPNIVNFLETIACHEETEIANVYYNEVEKLSHSCIPAWCENTMQNGKRSNGFVHCTSSQKKQKMGWQIY